MREFFFLFLFLFLFLFWSFFFLFFFLYLGPASEELELVILVWFNWFNFAICSYLIIFYLGYD